MIIKAGIVARICLWLSIQYQCIGEYLEQDLELILSGQNSDQNTNPEALGLRITQEAPYKSTCFPGFVTYTNGMCLALYLLSVSRMKLTHL